MPARGQSAGRTTTPGARIENEILAEIPDEEYRLIQPELEFLAVGSYQTLHEPGEALEYAYFPNAGMISIVIEISDGRTLEVGIVTRRGFAGESLTIGARICPYRMLCQPAVEGFRIAAEVLQKLLPATPNLQLRMERYVRFHSARAAQIAACNRFHEIEQRLARWLLMSQDRLGTGLLPFTHEYLASMLGAGRASVSLAAGVLQDAGLIRYRRGAVKMLNRRKLEEAACECYRTIRQFEAESENGA